MANKAIVFPHNLYHIKSFPTWRKLTSYVLDFTARIYVYHSLPFTLLPLDSLSQHISFRSPVHFINNVSIHVIVQLFKHKAICSTNIYKVYCMCQEFYCRATDYTQFLASKRSLSKVSDKMSKRDIDETSYERKNSELCLIWWYTQNQSVIHELTSISKAAMSVLGFLSNDAFISPCLSNRLNFVGTVRPSLEIKKTKSFKKPLGAYLSFW